MPVQDDDGGVSRRLARRFRIGAAVMLLVGAVLLLVGVLRPPSLPTVLAMMVGLAAVGIGAVLVVRTLLWAGMTTAPVPASGGARGVIGAANALSPVRPGAPTRRKLGALIVPIRVTDGPQPGGGALLIHARADGLAPVADDAVRVWRAGRAGPESLAPGETSGAVRGRFLLRRESDGAVFLGTTRLTDAV